MYDKIIQAGLAVDDDHIDPGRKVDLALKAAKAKEAFLLAHGDEANEEKRQLLRDIRDALRHGDCRGVLAGIKSRRSFRDVTPR